MNLISKPTWLSQGKSFFHGVRFSVQTISLGRFAYRWWEALVPPKLRPSGEKVQIGWMVFVRVTKLKEEQKRPDSEFTRSIQAPSTPSLWKDNLMIIGKILNFLISYLFKWGWKVAKTSAPGPANLTGNPHFCVRHKLCVRLRWSSLKECFCMISPIDLGNRL